MTVQEAALAALSSADMPACHRFRVAAAAEPGVLPRALELFAKRGLVPAETHAVTRPGPAAGDMRLILELAVDGLAPGAAETIAAALRQIVAVDAVLVHGPADGPGR